MRTDSPELKERKEQRAVEVAATLKAAIVRTLQTPEGRRVWIWIRYGLCQTDDRAPGALEAIPRFEGRRDVAYDMEEFFKDYPELANQVDADWRALRADEARFKAVLAKPENQRPEAAPPDQGEE